MNTKEKLEAVRQACIKANPEIVELKFGCYIEIDIRSIMCPATFLSKNYAGNLVVLIGGEKATYKEKEVRKVIGRPIRLADVMLAIGRRMDTFHVSGDGWFCVLQEPYMTYARRHQWNLSKDSLDEQSEETISFLYELLK